MQDNEQHSQEPSRANSNKKDLGDLGQELLTKYLEAQLKKLKVRKTADLPKDKEMAVIFDTLMAIGSFDHVKTKVSQKTQQGSNDPYGVTNLPFNSATSKIPKHTSEDVNKAKQSFGLPLGEPYEEEESK